MRRHYNHLHRRHFATKYTARITTESPDGRSLAVSVTPLPTLPTDARGYPLPRRHLICLVANLLNNQSPSPFTSLHDHLLPVSPPLTVSEASEILKSLSCPRLALTFFQFCPSHIPNFRHDPFTYNRMLHILSKSPPHDISTVRSILDEMDRTGVRGNISTVNILIGMSNGGEGLERCLGLMEKWELRLNCYTYKCLLQAYLRSSHLNKAFDVYVEMRRRGYKLDIFAYNMLLDALVKDEKV